MLQICIGKNIVCIGSVLFVVSGTHWRSWNVSSMDWSGSALLLNQMGLIINPCLLLWDGLNWWEWCGIDGMARRKYKTGGRKSVNLR